MQPHSAFDSGPIRIVIAAAQVSLRQGLRRQLESEPRIEVVGEAPDGRMARMLIRRFKPDILLIDCALNRVVRLTPALARRTCASTTGVVVLISTARTQNIIEAFELGAKGVLTGECLPRHWKTGIQSILAGHYWVAEENVAILLQAARESLARPNPQPIQEYGLTPREIGIAEKIAAGRSNKDIGMDFSICERTVKHHLSNIFRKLGISSRLSLALLVRGRS